MGMAFSAVISMISMQAKEAKYLNRQISSMSLKYFILQTLNAGYCGCQFKRHDASINENSPQPQDIDIGFLTNVCENPLSPTPDSNNIIVEAGKAVKGTHDLIVDSVKVIELQRAVVDDEYNGRLEVKYKPHKYIRPIKSIEIPVTLNINKDMGTPTARPIASCWGEGDYDCYTADEESATGRVLIGCGGTTDNSVNHSTAIGFKAGSSNTGTGIENTFIGYQAGSSNTTGPRNTFIGYQAGLHNLRAFDNTFVGDQAGLKNETGTGNTFLGSSAGRLTKNAGGNVFIGAASGHDNTSGAFNIYIGDGAGTGPPNQRRTGGGNIFIGHLTGRNLSPDVSNKFILGNYANPPMNPLPREWLTGDITSTGHLYVNNNKVLTVASTEFTQAQSDIATLQSNLAALQSTHPHNFAPPHSHPYAGSGHGHGGGGGGGGGDPPFGVVTAGGFSSQTLKKNIKPFKDFNKALEDIIQTPLFTYQYKAKNLHPEKKRMGVISEKLPKHLQIKEKDKPSRPDWMSIYGSFWAGIKALYKKLDLLRKEVLSQVDLLRKEFFSSQDINSQHIEGLKTNQEVLKKEFVRMKEKLKETEKELEKIKKELVKKIKSLEAD